MLRSFEDTMTVIKFIIIGLVRHRVYVEVKAPQDVDVLAVHESLTSQFLSLKSQTSLFLSIAFVVGATNLVGNFWDAKQESQAENKEFRNPGRRGRRRPVDAWSKPRSNDSRGDTKYTTFIGLRILFFPNSVILATFYQFKVSKWKNKLGLF